MSDEPTKPADPTPPAPDPKPDKTKVKKPGRWRRRLFRLAIVLLVLAVGMRVAVYFLLPSILNKVGDTYGLQITFERQEMVLLGGDVGIWGLKVAPKAGGPALFDADYVRGNISTIALIQGRLHALRVEADGVRMNLERTADGRIPALENLLAPKPGTTPAVAPSPEVQPAKEMNFASPLQIDALRLHKMHATVRDAAVTPALSAVVDGSADRPTLFEMEVWCDPALDSLLIGGEGKTAGGTLDLKAHVAVRGLHPRPLAGYLTPLGVRPVADNISGEFQASVHIAPAPAPAPAGAIAASLTMQGMQFRADGREWAALEQVRIQAEPVDARSARIADVAVDRGRFSASRDSAGLINVAGFQLVPVAATTRPVDQPFAAAPPGPRPAPFIISVGRIVLRDLAASFRDEAVQPAADWRAVIEEITAATKTTGADAPIDLRGRIALPGIARAATFDGTAAMAGGRTTVDVRFGAVGLRADVLTSYLAGTGIESALKDGRIDGKLSAELVQAADGSVSAETELSGLKLSDGDELIAMETVRIKGARLDGRTGRIHVDAVDVSGPSFLVQRNTDGSISTSGIRLSVPAASADAPARAVAAAPVATTRPATGPAPSLPRIELGRFTWGGLRMKLIDQQVQPPAAIEITDAGIEVKDLILDLASKDDAARPGSVRIWLKSPQVAKSLTVDGTLTPQPGALAADLKVRGNGLNLQTLAAYLRPLGIEPLLREGAIQVDLKGTVSAGKDGTLGATISLTDMALREGGDELMGLDEIRVEDVTLAGQDLGVGAVRINRPRASVLRRADETLVVAGVCLVGRSPTKQVGAGASVSAKPPAKAPTTAPAPATVTLGRFELKDAQIAWTDEAMPHAVRLAIVTNASADRIIIGKPAPASPIDLRVAIKDVADELSIKGEVVTSPDAPAAKVQITARGLRAGPAAKYLPPGIESSLKDGRLRLSVDAGFAPNPQGGHSARLSVRDLDWRDGEEVALFHLDALTLIAARVDVPGNIIAVDEISLAGLEAAASRTADGGMRAGGVIIRPAPVAHAPAAPAAPPLTPPAPPAVQPPADMAKLVAEARRPLPLVKVKTLDLGIRRLSFSDEAKPSASPVAFVAGRFHNLIPIELGGPEAESRPPVRLQLVGQVEPVAGQLDLTAELTPFANEPGIDLKLAVSGIRGQGLTELLPELAQQIDGSQLTDGRFNVRLQSHVRYNRRGPRDFDMSRGFDLDVLLSPLEMRGSEGGPVLAGVESVQSDGIRIEPATGRVQIKSLEITKPAGRFARDASGLHAVGLVIKPTPAPTTAPTGAPAPSPAPAPVATAQPAVAAPSGSEIRLDRLLVSGVDVRFEDRTVSPALVIPLTELDVEVRDLSSLSASQPPPTRPIRFSMALSSGKVPLPARKGGTIEERELFSQVTASGSLVFYPSPVGYVKTAINGLDLVAFSPMASQKGIKLGNGFFDGTVDLRLRDEGSFDARTKLVMTDLSVSEPPDGFLRRTFALPAPLDVVIAALEDADGSITIPLHVPVEKGKVSAGAVVGSASGALLGVIGTAIVSAPLKVVGGFGKTDQPAGGPPPVVIAFAPGSASLDAGERRKLDQLIERAGRDKNLQMMVRHELGGADVATATVRANPSAADALELAGRLRVRRAELLHLRASLAAEVRAELGGGAAARAEVTRNRLRSADAEIGEIEQSLDQLYDLLRPGAQRQADRRTRAGAMEIAQQRLQAVKSVLEGARIENQADRIRSEAARFNPADSQAAGQITILLTTKKKG
ncbi:MAG: DUF748 domain-containing protein [Planctomycetes bacterium]|nr:DUF748 domain-containing protein [Planctomycetota bacterium]